MALLPRPVMMMIWSHPAPSASSTPYWMTGLSTRTSISFGCALVAGRKRVPRPAAGKIALRMIASMRAIVSQLQSLRTTAETELFRRHFPARTRVVKRADPGWIMVDPTLLRDNLEALRAGLQKRGLDMSAELDELAALEARRRRLLPELEGLKREQNTAG